MTRSKRGPVHPFYFLVPATLYDELKKAASREARVMADIAREAITTYLAQTANTQESVNS